MRPVSKELYTDNSETYTPYGKAKEDLFKAIGNFCSYCEREGFFSSLAVEHIHDKNNNPELENEWSNFLLACNNCNSIKGTKDVNFDEVFFPHLENTFRIFEYLEGGLIVVDKGLSNVEKNKVKELVELVGLLRRPGVIGYSSKDLRWRERLAAWNLAKKYLNKLERNECDEESILDIALAKGFWSVWMTVFKGKQSVQKLFIQSFKGTNSSFFEDLLV